ncbi:MAG: gliding motility-associated C-terminal domain-containing protein, partial [Bacteroidota bacterium]
TVSIRGKGGRNEVFSPVPTAYAKIISYEVNIFNRWGRKVFTADDPDASWDGTMGGQPLPEGVYLCLVRIRVKELFGERSYTQQAQVSLLR